MPVRSNPKAVAEQSTGLFRPLQTNTASALLTVSSDRPLASPENSENCDVGDDVSYLPDTSAANGLARRSLYENENCDEDETDSEPDAELYEPDGLEDVGEWAASPAGIRANLTARVRPRNNANARHAAAVDRMQRAEDRRREHVARDKLDRATVEQVMDPRTRMILFRLLSRGKLVSLDGCVSTGKEANVYYGTGAENAGVAVKVFKTAILSFKDRERYVAGEFRFRRAGYNRSSNRKMVQQWAEKEYRNLLRLKDAGIPSPTPLILKSPVLVMTFFGDGGWPAPRLKDASLSSERLSIVYVQVCCLMRRMYRRAKLVHGDLSEYNILYHQGQAVIIDVSQSVEDDHPLALDFLRRDCLNINDFFNRGGVAPVLGVRELFQFVTHVDLSRDKSETCEEDEEMLQRLEDISKVARDRTEEENLKTAEDDKVFLQTFIPRALGDIVDHEGEVLKVAAEGADSVLFGKLADISIASQMTSSVASGVQAANNVEPPIITKEANDDSSSDAHENSVRSASSSGSWSEEETRLSPEEAKNLRKEQKKTAKAESRAKRAEKTPKYVKKRKETLAKRRRHLKA